MHQIKNPENLYYQFGRLLQDMPELTNNPSIESQQWLGRAYAAVSETGDTIDSVNFKFAINRLSSANWLSAAHEIRAIIFRGFAVTELAIPLGLKGTFIPVGNTFDAFSALTKLFKTAKHNVFIVDPYLDEAILTEYGLTVPEKISFRLLADKSDYKTSLKTAGEKWILQYPSNRPLEIRLADTKLLHDRCVFIDQDQAWSLSQSIKDFAKKSPAEIINAKDTASLKIVAYEEIWQSATILIKT
jgi:hypothetical protein